MGELSKLPNIGPKVEKQLNEIGVTTVEELKQKGAKEAWFAIRLKDPSACFNRLCALEGAIQNTRWPGLPEETKADLKAYYEKNKA